MDLKSTVGGKMAVVFFKDGGKLRKGELHLQADQLRLGYHKKVERAYRLVFNPKVRPYGVVFAGETLLKVVPRPPFMPRCLCPIKTSAL